MDVCELYGEVLTVRLPANNFGGQTDPGQLHNLLSAGRIEDKLISVAGFPIPKVVARLDALLLVLKSCEGRVCREPWLSLHPAGDVSSLSDALESRFDSFYETEQTRVEYSFCSNGYLIEAEGPMWETHGKLFTRGELRWDEWV